MYSVSGLEFEGLLFFCFLAGKVGGHMKTTKREIPVRALISLRECVKTLPFFDLSLNLRQNERLYFMSDAKEVLANCLEQRLDQETWRHQLEGFFAQHYKESFFDFRIQYESGKEKDFKIISRLADYIYRHGYTYVAGRTEYYVPIRANYHGVSIDGLRDHADMILQTPEGKRLALVIKSGKPKYSYAAKSESSKAENSIELASLYLGLADMYGTDLEVAVFYWKNRDDTGTHMEEEFEHRKGKNIISATYPSKKEAWKRLSYAVSLVVPPDCSSCWYREVCRTAHYYSCMQPADSTTEHRQPDRVPKKRDVLTPQQQEVVAHKDGAMCVIAVPGAGKTHSLVQRLVHLIQDEHVDPSKILFLAFTQKAVGEIKERIQNILGQGAGQPGIFTFNGLGYSILREHPEILEGRLYLATKVDRYRLIEQALKKTPRIKGMSYDGIIGEYGLLSSLNKAFEWIEDFGRERYRAENEDKKDVDGIMAVYEAFLEDYQENGYISYDDQIRLVNKLFAERPHVLAHYQMQYQYVCVDEYQDISEQQVRMVYSIAAHGNLVVVGDDDQSIFGWRGGSSQYMLEFKKHWPGARQVTMEDNFRSVDTVLHAADMVIRKNTDRFTKKIRAHSFSGIKPFYVGDVAAENVWELIEPLLSQGYRAGDIAVIARKNKELAVIEEKLLPYVGVLPCRQYLIEDAVFIGIHDILTLYCEGLEKDGAFYRFLHTQGASAELPERKASASSLYESLCRAGLFLPVDWRDINCLSACREKHKESHLFAAGYLLICIFKEIQYARNLEEALKKVFYLLFREENHLAVELLVNLANERRMERPEELLSYMDYMLRYRDETEIEYPRRDNAVNLLTAHKAKGKEYPVVIIYHIESYGDTPEDRCLLYVAMTRAESVLYLTQGPYSNAKLVPDFINQVEVYIRQAG